MARIRNFTSEVKEEIPFPDYCYLSIGAIIAVLSGYSGKITHSIILGASTLAALAQWRMRKATFSLKPEKFNFEALMVSISAVSRF